MGAYKNLMLILTGGSRTEISIRNFKQRPLFNPTDQAFFGIVVCSAISACKSSMVESVRLVATGIGVCSAISACKSSPVESVRLVEDTGAGGFPSRCLSWDRVPKDGRDVGIGEGGTD